MDMAGQIVPYMPALTQYGLKRLIEIVGRHVNLQEISNPVTARTFCTGKMVRSR
jgi:hypothetical protein